MPMMRNLELPYFRHVYKHRYSNSSYTVNRSTNYSGCHRCNMGYDSVRLNNLEKSVNEIKKAIEEYEEHNIKFREQTIGRVAYLEAKVNGRNKP